MQLGGMTSPIMECQKWEYCWTSWTIQGKSCCPTSFLWPGSPVPRKENHWSGCLRDMPHLSIKPNPTSVYQPISGSAMNYHESASQKDAILCLTAKLPNRPNIWTEPVSTATTQWQNYNELKSINDPKFAAVHRALDPRFLSQIILQSIFSQVRFSEPDQQPVQLARQTHTLQEAHS